MLTIRPEAALAHALDHAPGHVEHRVEVGPDDVAPLLGLHAMQGGIAGDPGVIDQHLDRPEIRLDFGDPGPDMPENRRRPTCTPGSQSSLNARRLVVPAVVRRYLVAGVL